MTMRQLALAIQPAPEPAFDNFVAGANAEVLTRLREVANGQARETVLYLWGTPGCGRTHLLRAAARAAPGAAYIDTGTNLPENPGALLAVDDVERLDDVAQVALFHLINRVRDSGGCVLAAGNTSPNQLTLREDLRSRLGWGLVYQLKPLDDAERAYYLHAEAKRRGLRLPDEVVGYLLTRVRRDLPSLGSILEHLDRYSLERQRPLTLPLVREALQDLDT